MQLRGVLGTRTDRIRALLMSVILGYSRRRGLVLEGLLQCAVYRATAPVTCGVAIDVPAGSCEREKGIRDDVVHMTLFKACIHRPSAAVAYLTALQRLKYICPPHQDRLTGC